MRIPHVVVLVLFLRLVYCLPILALLNMTLCCGIFGWITMNFTYMKYLFSHVFSKIDVSLLYCDVCIRAKQHRVSFPSQPYKPTRPFTLIHSDVWGPSKVTTSYGKRWFVTFIDDHTRLLPVSTLSPINLRFPLFSKTSITPLKYNFIHKLQFFGVITVENSKP